MNFSDTKILVIGDVMVDRYWFGPCDRISPEAPVPVVQITSCDDRLGGAANAAFNLSELGCNVSLYGLIADDSVGQCLGQLLANTPIANYCQSWLTNTTLKLRVLTRSQQIIRLDFEQSVDTSLALQFVEQPLLQTLINDCDIVLVSDYLKGSLQFLDLLIDKCRRLNKRIVIDPKSSVAHLHKYASILTPNRSEFESLLGYSVPDSALEESALSLLNLLELEALIVTLSEKGILCLSNSHTTFFPAVAREVVDVTGAGDVFASYLTALIACGVDVFEAASQANIAAGFSVERVGTTAIKYSEVFNYIYSSGKTKIFNSVPLLLSHNPSLSEPTVRTVFTNGCFDVIHAGHISYLREARKLGDRLIVAINDDASVTRLKGTSRPIHTLLHRLQVLSALEFVDYIIPFSADTPIDIITQLSPDILVKGSDYSIDSIVGADFVASTGGKVVTLPFVDNLSTTSILTRLND